MDRDEKTQVKPIEYHAFTPKMTLNPYVEKLCASYETPTYFLLIKAQGPDGFWYNGRNRIGLPFYLLEKIHHSNLNMFYCLGKITKP